MSRNVRSMYLGFGHDFKSTWDFLAKWDPSIVCVMLNGSKDDPESVSVEKVERIHSLLPQCRIFVRIWELDDNHYQQHRRMAANPIQFANEYHEYTRKLFDRIRVPNELLYMGALNEPNPREIGRPLFDYSKELALIGAEDNVRYGLFRFSAGQPPLPGEHEYSWDYYKELEGVINAGSHLVVLHEYMQPEGSRAVWTDESGTERSDYSYLIGRHHKCPLNSEIFIGEWGVDGLLYNRHPDPKHGNSGWRNFPEEWSPERIADEYVWMCQDVDPRVIGIAPFIDDPKHEQWWSFDMQPALGALLSRKHLAVSDQFPDADPPDDHNTYIPKIDNPKLPLSGVLDPYVLDAIVQAESDAKPFGPTGLPTMRFEAHIFLRHAEDFERARGLFRHHPEQPWREQERYSSGKWVPVHTGRQEDEKIALNLASGVDEDAAYLAISMGMGQIMGFNAQRVGYPDAQAMFKHFSRSESAQFLGIVNYILSDAELFRAVQARDWPVIALKYNGSGNVDEVAAIYEQKYQKAKA